MQRRKGFQLLDGGQDLLVDDDRLAEPVAAVDHPVPDGQEADAVEVRPGVPEGFTDPGQGVAVRRDGPALGQRVAPALEALVLGR